MLKRSESRHHIHSDGPGITRAREEAEALFRPKLKVIEEPAPKDPALIASSARQPRVLSVSVPPPVRADAAAPASFEPQIISRSASVPHVSLTQLERRRLDSARGAIFDQQRQLQAKLDTIESEMRAIDAYEAARNNKLP